MPDITLPELKGYLGIFDSTRDVRITALANTANAFVRHRTARDWGVKPRNENYQGNGMPALTLRHFPVTVLTSVSIFGVSIELADDRILTCDMQQGILYRTDAAIFAPTDWPGERGPYCGKFPFTPRYVVNVVYTGGRDVPDDLHGATLEIAQYIWNASGGLLSQSDGGVRVSLADKDLSKMPTVRDILESYQDPAAGYLS